MILHNTRQLFMSPASHANLSGENRPIPSSSMRAIMRLFIATTTAATAAALTLTLATAHASACDASQQIRLSVGDRQMDRWTGVSNSVRHIVLPNAFKLGVKIEQVSREKYEALLKRHGESSASELVRISLYDETEAAPRLITYTFGGTNSVQGYGPRGGADRVDEVGSPGIEFRLSKANCLGTADIAALPTAAMLKQTNEISQPSAENKRGRDAAIADAKAGNYIVNYPNRTLSQPEIVAMKRAIENAGLQFGTPDETVSGGYHKGYTQAMMEAIYEKFGVAKMREVEANIKVSMAALASLPAAK